MEWTRAYSMYWIFYEGFRLGTFYNECCIDNGLRLGMLTPYYAQKLREQFFPKHPKIIIPDYPKNVKVRANADNAIITAD